MHRKKSCQNTDGAATKLTSKEAFKTPGMARCQKNGVVGAHDLFDQIGFNVGNHW